ncbi:late competence development ComFB family protein [Reinekea thalattae]|uniref:Competence protein ComFB n=1 Tax=Reinekea thalattae TaxID=2593301 RepID=A0A5C8Z2U9_9GAMM|nr:late competence development ComFB family protein [Reinekea thalattae]TXR51877.1 competence protein ComFB [Reinekea thalattae]
MNFESQISNFYEKMVADDLKKRSDKDPIDDEMMVDIACVALNQLPSRYYRYSVDMAFYLETQEYQKMQAAVIKAVDFAIKFVETHKTNRAE